MTKLNFAHDVQGFNSYAPMQSDTKYSATLASGGSDDFDIPDSFQNCIIGFSFQPGSSVWVSVNGTAAAPAGATFAATASQLNPGSLLVKGGDNIDVYNAGADDAQIGVILYANS